MINTRLVDLLDSIQSGIACGKRDDSGVAQLRLNNLQTNGVVNFKDHIKIPSHLVLDEMLLKAGDVLFNNTNSVELVGKTVFFDGYKDKVTFSNHITRLRVKRDILDPEYLAFWLQHQWRLGIFVSICDRWIGQAAVQRRKLELFEVPTPSLNKQHQIVTCLKAQLAELDKALQAIEIQLRDANMLCSRVLKDIFAELESSPKKVLGDYANCTSGSTPSRGNKQYWQPAEIPWVKTAEVAFAPIAETEEAVSKIALDECSLTLLPPDSVLIAMYGQGKTRGQSALLKVPATTNQACFAILPNNSWEPEFLFYWLKSSYQDLRALSEDRGGNQANLNGRLLKALEIPAPDKATQIKIVKRIKAALIEAEEIEKVSKVMMTEIKYLPNKILTQAFEK